MMATLISKQYVITTRPGTDPNTELAPENRRQQNGARILFPTWVAV